MSHSRMAVGGVLLLATVLAACGGGDDASAEELESYFRGVEAAKTRYDAAEVPSLFTAQIPEIPETLRLQNGVLAGFAGDLRSLDAPASLAGDHDALVGLSDDRVALQEEVAVGLIGGGSLGQYVPLVEAAAIGWQQAVCVLQRRAAQADVTIELGCDPDDLLETRAVDRRLAPLVTGADACRRAETPSDEVNEQIATAVHFLNRTDSTVQVHRYTTAGQRELVATLEPRGDSLHLTHVGVGWVVTNEAGECLGAAFPVDVGGINVSIDFD